jgi:hypothetical protein
MMLLETLLIPVWHVSRCESALVCALAPLPCLQPEPAPGIGSIDPLPTHHSASNDT